MQVPSSAVLVLARACALISVSAAVAACSAKPEGTITVVTGGEADALTRAPAPVRLVAASVAADGTMKELARTPLPADGISLGDFPRTDVGAVAVTAFDAAGAVLVRGETLFVQWGALENVGLQVFVQRTGELARMPDGPPAFDATAATTTVGRYVLMANGTATALYDLLNLRTITSTPVFPRPARSLATTETTALVIDETGATAFNLQTQIGTDIAAPGGATFAEVAGGTTVLAPDGTQYIIGGTRTSGGPSTRVLRLATDGSLTALSFGVPREGACATYVDGRGLVVYGGSATGAGGELLAPNAASASALPYPADGIHGCGAAALDGTNVLVTGAEARIVDLGCAADCAAKAWPGEPLGLVRADVVRLAPDAALVVGDDASGATKAFRVSATARRDVPLKTPRRGARLLALPNGFAAVVGGAPGIEQYLE